MTPAAERIPASWEPSRVSSWRLPGITALPLCFLLEENAVLLPDDYRNL